VSRSYRKVYGGGITTAPSDKSFKVLEHRSYRRIVRGMIANGEDEIFPIYGGKFGDPWCSPKDGHTVYCWSIREYLRTTIIWDHIRKGRRDGAMRYYHIYRPATIADWKKAIAK
jgi:hypothetical protein